MKYSSGHTSAFFHFTSFELSVADKPLNSQLFGQAQQSHSSYMLSQLFLKKWMQLDCDHRTLVYFGMLIVNFA